MKENKEDLQSKTQVKKALLEITKLGEVLILQPITLLDRLPLTHDVKKAILEAKKLKKIALKRQIGYIGKLLRNSNHDEIQASWHKIQLENQSGSQRFHQIEMLRTNLIDDQSKKALSDFFDQYPYCDRQKFRQLVTRAKEELNLAKPNKTAYRELFQQIKAIMEQQDELE